MTKLVVGSKAPAFTLTDKNGKKVTLSSIKSKYTVLYFYPKDDTPGCTIESKEFSDALATFKKAGAEIIGISGGNDAGKQKFCTKHKLTITLLSDPEFTTAKAYGSYGKKKFMGREYMGIMRNTFLLDAEKKVLAVFEEVTPKGHAKEVITAITQGTAPKRPVSKAAIKAVKPKTVVKKTAAKTRTAPKKTVKKPTGKTASVRSKAR